VGLKIYYTNDMHNRSGALDALDQVSDRASSLLLDTGDAIGGSNTAFRLHEPILARMERLGYRAMAMGNREFHYLRWVQWRRQRERKFPILAANLQDLRTQPQPWQASFTLRMGNMAVTLVGVTPVQFPAGSPWERVTGFRFLDPAVCLPPLLEELRPGCDLLILLSHLGLPVDRELAPRLPGVDLILGGHSHDVTEQPLKLGSSWLVHGGSHSRFLAELEVDLQPLNIMFHLQRLAA
jgi:2',3'-cyclic-nucleotide 2'-phosphodiesterase (5'-nucleotidase family)